MEEIKFLDINPYEGIQYRIPAKSVEHAMEICTRLVELGARLESNGSYATPMDYGRRWYSMRGSQFFIHGAMLSGDASANTTFIEELGEFAKIYRGKKIYKLEDLDKYYPRNIVTKGGKIIKINYPSKSKREDVFKKILQD